MTNSKILHIVLAVIHKEDEVLLIRRAQVDAQIPELTWAFPGGKVRQAENVYQIEKHIGARNYPAEPEILQDYYLCRPKDSEPLIASEPEEVAEIKWVTAKEASNYFTSDVAPQVLEVLKEIQQEKSAQGQKETIH